MPAVQFIQSRRKISNHLLREQLCGNFITPNHHEDGIQPIKSELVALCDQHIEFNDYYAFFCNASRFLIAADEAIGQSAVYGLERFSGQLIKWSQYFKERLLYLSQHVDV